MIPRKRYLHLARVVLQNRTALSLVTGHPDRLFDTSLVRDANGLPAIPGTAIAGVLRSLYSRLKAHDEQAVNFLFGHATATSSEVSPLQTSWGMIHSAQDRPMFGLRLGTNREALEEDPLLATLLEDRYQRERVRINHRGSASDEGKFDRAVLPAGCRFSVELTLESDHAEDADWSNVLGLLAHPMFRLGANTRSGLGSVDVIRCLGRSFDLQSPDDAQAFRDLSPDPGDVEGLVSIEPLTLSIPGYIGGALELEPEDFYRFGGDQDPFDDDAERPADLLPRFEPTVAWDGGSACLNPARLLIPASSVKGALAHRFTWHYNALTGVYAEDLLLDTDAGWDKNQACPGTRALFGHVDDRNARAGCLLIDDATQAISREALRNLMHNAIDQFTGGVRRGMLFSEDMVANKRFPRLSVLLDTQRLEQSCREEEADPELVRRALAATVADLCEGRLALGAASSRGHGYFSGRLSSGALSQYLTERMGEKA